MKKILEAELWNVRRKRKGKLKNGKMSAKTKKLKDALLSLS